MYCHVMKQPKCACLTVKTASDNSSRKNEMHVKENILQCMSTEEKAVVGKRRQKGLVEE